MDDSNDTHMWWFKGENEEIKSKPSSHKYYFLGKKFVWIKKYDLFLFANEYLQLVSSLHVYTLVHEMPLQRCMDEQKKNV